MINIGNSSIENILVGDTQVDKVYLGTDVVWEHQQNDHDYVEIGGVQWATMNVGANNVTDTGLYFLWGDTQGYAASQVGTDKLFSWSDYKYTNDGGSTMTKYNSTDNKTVLDLSDDPANFNWGSDWRLPTTAELQALRDAVNTSWTNDYQDSGVAGLVCTDKNDSSKVLFFPACGNCLNGRVINVGSLGYCWSSSLLSSGVQNAYGLRFLDGLVYWQGYYNRYNGLPVRAVHVRDYLKFTALESGTFTFTIPAAVNTSYITSISYSLDNGATWVTTLNTSSDVTITTPTVALSGTVLWKGDGTRTTTSNVNYYCYFSSTGRFNASGNIMSLLYEDNFENVTTILEDNCFNRLFLNCLTIVTPPELPATTVSASCYSNMFYGCTSLEYAPDLPATTISTYSYGYMFANCTSLRRAPAILPSLTVYNQSYYHMFDGCSSLINAPDLPATTISGSCYQCMFKNCYSLNTAPSILPATRVYSGCYLEMFNGCSSLTNAPELPATELALQCYMYMFLYCISLINAPELPATTLAPHCYNNMFYGCTNLETAPSVLPATTLVTLCYRWMFGNCGKINRIKALFTTTPTSDYTYNWVSGVSSTGTFVKNVEATWDVRGTNGIPTNWTVVDYNS